YLRNLTGKKRSDSANRQLGLSLAFVAGATNAGGFMAVDQYTSHMSGIVSSMADNLAVNNLMLVLVGLGSVISFIGGAAYSAILINWGRHHRTHSAYAYPLLWEAGLLLCFGLMGGYLELHQSGFVPITVVLLCFIMGLQNAIITKISNAEIRTTHMTGIVTDIGIEIGKIFYINSSEETGHYKPVHANFKKLRLLAALLSSFFVGGLAGALGFKYIGYSSTLPLAVLLVFLAIVPLVDDMRTRSRVLTRARLRHRVSGRPRSLA
ncbi:MAG TPA: YoaK family protein, partial [Patescibacteria group bacterium]|nr:YoaK family protein [Patescibacteria group bacterium]